MLKPCCTAEPPAATVRAPSSHKTPHLGLPTCLHVHLFDLLSYLAIARPDQPRFARKSANRMAPELFRYVDCSSLSVPDELQSGGIQFATGPSAQSSSPLAVGSPFPVEVKLWLLLCGPAGWARSTSRDGVHGRPGRQCRS